MLKEGSIIDYNFGYENISFGGYMEQYWGGAWVRGVGYGEN